MDENYTIQKLLTLRKLTRAIGEVVCQQMAEYVTALTPLFRQKSIFGDHIQGGSKEPVKGADQAFKELQTLYEAVVVTKPFHLPKELKSPLIQMTGTLELTPVEYTHLAKGAAESREITVSRPFKSVIAYSGYGPRRLTGLLTDISRNNGELQQFVLHYLAMHILLSKQSGLSKLFHTLHFPIEIGRLPGFGELPITFIASSISTSLPPDELIIESTELSGKNAFEEIVNVGDIEQLGDPLKERLLDLIKS
jgi:hypothetical protein